MVRAPGRPANSIKPQGFNFPRVPMPVAEVQVQSTVAVEGLRLPRPEVLHTTDKRPLIRLLRPRQWIKNSFVFAPLIFSGSFVHPAALVNAVVATALFCFAASATYIF